MAEPTTTTATAVGLTGALLLLIGPEFGPLLAPIIGDYLLIMGGSLAGVMHPVSTREFATRLAAVWYVLLWVGTAVVLTGFSAAMIERYMGLPASNWLGAVAFGITFLADKWPGLIEFGVGWVKSKAGGAA